MKKENTKARDKKPSPVELDSGLLARDVTAKGLGLEPVEDDENAVASCRGKS